VSAREPLTSGARHALNLLGMWIQHAGVRRVYVRSADPFWVREMLLRMPLGVQSVCVDVDGLEAQGWRFAVTRAAQGEEMVVIPFLATDLSTNFVADSRIETDAERWVAGCFRSVFSYRRLINPFLDGVNPLGMRRILQARGYAFRDWRGVYPPAFLFWWALSLAAGTRFSSLHWQWSARAEQYIESRRVAFCHLGAFFAERQ
jgi:hypothetical protein